VRIQRARRMGCNQSRVARGQRARRGERPESENRLSGLLSCLIEPPHHLTEAIPANQVYSGMQVLSVTRAGHS